MHAAPRWCPAGENLLQLRFGRQGSHAAGGHSEAYELDLRSEKLALASVEDKAIISEGLQYCPQVNCMCILIRAGHQDVV